MSYSLSLPSRVSQLPKSQLDFRPQAGIKLSYRFVGGQKKVSKYRLCGDGHQLRGRIPDLRGFLEIRIGLERFFRSGIPEPSDNVFTPFCQKSSEMILRKWDDIPVDDEKAITMVARYRFSGLLQGPLGGGRSPFPRSASVDLPEGMAVLSVETAIAKTNETLSGASG